MLRLAKKDWVACGKTVEIHGLTMPYFEAGMGRIVWVVQDSMHRIPNRLLYRCTKCRAFLDKRSPLCGIPGERMTVPAQCTEGEHDFQPYGPWIWLPKGRHFIENGDVLTIYSKDEPRTVLWQGTIDLVPSNMPLEPDTQKGVEPMVWEGWFQDQMPVRFIKHLPAPIILHGFTAIRQWQGERAWWAFIDLRYYREPIAGMISLRDGHFLRIYKRDGVHVEWEGRIVAPVQKNPGPEKGLYSPAEAAGIPIRTWARWFLENRMATLVIHRQR